MSKKVKWDFPKSYDIVCFDHTMSYELTGYRPINETEGLDFDPDKFNVAGRRYMETGHYCEHPKGTNKFKQFWTEEIRRIEYGLEIDGYRITGDNYAFINYYVLPVTKINPINKKEYTEPSVPSFFTLQYEFFHYLELCEVLGYDCLVGKARGLGFSEIAACLGGTLYTYRNKSVSLYTANKDKFVTDVFAKTTAYLDHLSNNTNGGFRRLRYINKDTKIQAGTKGKNGQNVGKYSATVDSLLVVKPSNIRGDRTARFFMEEAGSYACLIDAYIVADALVNVMGNKIGTRFVWGTGGDTGTAVKGLKKMMYNPQGYNILPHKHNYTDNGSEIYSGFFAPAHRMVKKYRDGRGHCDEVKGNEHFDNLIKAASDDSKRRLEAENARTVQDMFLNEGSDFFNTDAIVEQEATIERGKLTDDIPKVEKGNLHWVRDKKQRITDVIWQPTPTGVFSIVEGCHPSFENDVMISDKYISGIDGIDVGKSNSVVGELGSKFCILIKERLNGIDGDQYCALYLERPDDERIAFDNALKLMVYYRCKTNLEDTKRSLVQYFKQVKQFHKLIKRPEIALSDNVRNSKRRNNLIGTPGSERIANFGDTIVKDYVMDSCHKIFFPEMLEELRTYDNTEKRKFDIIAAMRMTEIYDEHLRGKPVYDKPKDVEVWEDFGWYEDESGYRKWGTKNSKKNVLEEPDNEPAIRYVDLENNKVVYHGDDEFND